MAVSLRESTADEIHYRSQKEMDAGRLKEPILFNFERIKAQHFVGFDYEPQPNGEKPKTMQVKTQAQLRT